MKISGNEFEEQCKCNAIEDQWCIDIKDQWRCTDNEGQCGGDNINLLLSLEAINHNIVVVSFSLPNYLIAYMNFFLFSHAINTR